MLNMWKQTQERSSTVQPVFDVVLLPLCSHCFIVTKVAQVLVSRSAGTATDASALVIAGVARALEAIQSRGITAL